jgi:hypothetical protein
MTISNPVNETQRQFNRLCELGGGVGGGPARTRVQALLHRSGAALNVVANDEISSHLAEYHDRNPWHVCFAVGLCWGHLARLELDFTGAAVSLMERWNDDDLRVARRFHYERGPDPIDQSLRGAHILFQRVTLPEELPSTLAPYRRAQERWLSPILSPDRPRYIGSWNATAMFMIALFANTSLAAQLLTPVVMLPPGGPIYNALSILHTAHVLSRPPAGSELDDEAFEPGAIYENNALFEELLRGHAGWNLLDVHSGLYMLGTRLAESNNWF